LGNFSSKSPGYQGYVALIIGILSIALSPIMVRWTNAPGVITSFYRLMLGSLFMAIPFGVQLKQKPQTLSRRGIWFGVLAGFFFSLDMFFWTTGIMMSGATNPTLLANTAPLWVGLGAWLIYRERQTTKFWLGMVVAIIGAALVLGQDLWISTQLGLGTLFGVLAAIFYGGFQLVGQLGRQYLNTLNYFWISTTASALFLLILALILRAPLWGYSTQTWVMFLIMAVLVQCIGWLAVNHAQGYLPAAIISPSMLLQPLLTALLAPMLLGETFTTWHIIGGILIILGVMAVHRSR